jgi:hypothetical protein
VILIVLYAFYKLKPGASLVYNQRGGGLVMEGNCFENNQLNSVGPALSYRTEAIAQPQVSNNFNADAPVSDGGCALLSDIVVEALLDDGQIVTSEQCLPPDLDTCPLEAVDEVPTQAPAPTAAPTAAQAPTPTAVPSGPAGDCISNLTEIYLAERVLFANETSLSTREYILCPNTNFKTGFFDQENVYRDGQYPIIPRSNMIIKCGGDGAQSNNCTIRGGADGIVRFPDSYVWRGNPETSFDVYIAEWDHYIDNFTIMGVTISETVYAGAFIQGVAGTGVKIIDCAFTVCSRTERINAQTILGPNEYAYFAAEFASSLQHCYQQFVSAGKWA